MNEIHEHIVNDAPDAIIFAGLDGNIQVWNKMAEDIFGYSDSEALGKSLDIIIPPQLQKAHWDGFKKAIQSGETKYKKKILTTKSIHKNGNVIYVNLTFSILKDKSGKVTGALAFARDYTEQYLKEKAARKSALKPS